MAGIQRVKPWGKFMQNNWKWSILFTAVVMAGCASPGEKQQAATSVPAKPAAVQPANSNERTVKSVDGSFEGEIVGKPAAGSKFSKVKIGMSFREVTKLIGAPDDMLRHETGKRWIPFYYGNDAQRLQTLYRGEGCLTFTGGNIFGGGGEELLRITVDPKGTCLAD
jgi:hypothetical protein